MKIGPVVEHDKGKHFLQKSFQKMSQEGLFKSFLFFKKYLCELKESDLQLSFSMLWESSTQHTMKISGIRL